MANFFIQIDKPFYFAGDTVNGSILVNVGAFIQSTGISLKFTGYECVKWNDSRQIVRPRPVEGQPPPPDPIAAIPPHLIFNSDNFNVSDIEEAENTEYDHRPRYIRTSQGRVYEMKYYETRNVFTTIKTMVYICNGLAPGQYSFPISFKTFQGWPASFDYNTPRKKGRIVYHMTAAVEPTNPVFQMKHAIEITMRETKALSASTKKSVAEITSCCCLNKGTSSINVHFEKDGYTPGEQVRMIIEIDNTNCEVDVTSLNISVTNTVGLRSSQGSTSDTHHVFSKSVNGVPAGTKMVGNQAIKEGFILQSNNQIKPTCSGKLLSSYFDLNIGLSYDISCDCCSSRPAVSLRIMIFPHPRMYQLPSTFTNNWAPKVMPAAIFELSNTFNNFNLSNMSQNYPPPPPPMLPVPPPNMNNMAANTMNATINQANTMNNMAMNEANMANNMAMNQNNMAMNQANLATNMATDMTMNQAHMANNMAMNQAHMANNMAMNMNDSMNANFNNMNGNMNNMNANMNTDMNPNFGGMNMNGNMNGNMGGYNMEMTARPINYGGPSF